MQTRILGRTGLAVGEIGLGTENLGTDRKAIDAVFDLAVNTGVNYIDLVYNDPLSSGGDYIEEDWVLKDLLSVWKVCLHNNSLYAISMGSAPYLS